MDFEKNQKIKIIRLNKKIISNLRIYDKSTTVFKCDFDFFDYNKNNLLNKNLKLIIKKKTQNLFQRIKYFYIIFFYLHKFNFYFVYNQNMFIYISRFKPHFIAIQDSFASSILRKTKVYLKHCYFFYKNNYLIVLN